MDGINKSMNDLGLEAPVERSVCRSREGGGNAERPAKRAKRRVVIPKSSMAAPTGAQPRLSGPQREERTIPSQFMPPFIRTVYVPGSGESISEVSTPSINSGLSEQTRYPPLKSLSSASQNRRQPTTAEDLEGLHASLNNKLEAHRCSGFY